MARHLPILDWGRAYDRQSAANDLVAALIVTVLLIPQSLAYAMLAGLSPETGLYASVAPLLLYAVFGSSRMLAVGPVAIVSLMTASAAGEVARAGLAAPAEAALALALLSGLMLVAMGLLRLGLIANFLSHPVISGFVTASGLLIAAGQVKHLLGIAGDGQTLPEIAMGLAAGLPATNPVTLALGLGTLGFLLAARRWLRPGLMALGLARRPADLAARLGPVAAVVATTLLVIGFGLEDAGVKTVGAVPAGLPPLTLPGFDPALWRALLLPALLISLVGFVESVSVGQTLAARRRQRIEPDQELIGLGAANLGAAVTGGMPVTGGFARSVVNADAGAATPAAGIFTAAGIGIVTLWLTPLLAHLPVATLAATIIVAVLSLVDLGTLRRIFVYSRSDFAALAATILVTLTAGVEPGIVAGVALSILLHVWRTSRPHSAVVGQVPGTEHFRNVKRHAVVTAPEVLSLRIDESLYFANARFLEDRVLGAVAADPRIRDVILMCPAVNAIDGSALESLEALNSRLREMGVRLHLSEVKGPVMDRLRRTHFPEVLTGRIHLTQFDAFRAICPELADRTRAAVRDGLAAAE